MLEQAVVFSTSGGIEFTDNISRTTLNPNAKFKGWTWRNEVPLVLHAKTTSLQNQNGPVLRFEPGREMPFESLSIDAIQIPRFGMMSHFVGPMAWELTIPLLAGLTPPATATPGWGTQATKVLVTGFFTAYDCNSPVEALRKWTRMLTKYVDPVIKDPVVWEQGGLMDAITLTLSPGFSLKIWGDTATLANNAIGSGGYGDFWGSVINPNYIFASTTSYTLDVGVFFHLNFPTAKDIRLNSKIVLHQSAERNYSRNMEKITSTQLLASFPLAHTNTNIALPSHFFMKNPATSPTVLKATRSNCCVDYIDFWFTYGDDENPLYFVPGTGFLAADLKTTVTVTGGTRGTGWNATEGGFTGSVDETLRNLFKEGIFIYATLNKCDCPEDRDKYIASDIRFQTR